MNKVAVVFPGQGSQKVGMLADIATEYPIIQQTFHEASSILDYDLWQLVQEGPVEKLNQTEYTQAVMLTSDVALWRALQLEIAMTPDFLAGHSLGEYSALVISGVLSFADALKLVAKRGRLMQDAVPEGQGAMAAIIGLDIDAVNKLCLQEADGEVLEPANMNATGQIVISGALNAVDRAIAKAKSIGAQLALKLPMSVPAHSSLMKSAAYGLKQEFDKIVIKQPTMPIIHNVDVQTHSLVDEIRIAMVLQVTSPVRWVDTIKYFKKHSIEQIVECGPGSVLTGLIKSTEPSIATVNLDTLANFKKFIGG